MTPLSVNHHCQQLCTAIMRHSAWGENSQWIGLIFLFDPPGPRVQPNPVVMELNTAPSHLCFSATLCSPIQHFHFVLQRWGPRLVWQKWTSVEGDGPLFQRRQRDVCKLCDMDDFYLVCLLWCGDWIKWKASVCVVVFAACSAAECYLSSRAEKFTGCISSFLFRPSVVYH